MVLSYRGFPYIHMPVCIYMYSICTYVYHSLKTRELYRNRSPEPH